MIRRPPSAPNSSSWPFASTASLCLTVAFDLDSHGINERPHRIRRLLPNESRPRPGDTQQTNG